MSESVDVLIVGGAAMGASIAYFLASDPAFDGEILVVERDSTYADCSSARSWGVLRQQFSTPENVQMSLFGIDFVSNVGDHLAVDGEVPDLSFRRNGVLFLASEEGLPTLARNVETQNAQGGDVELLDLDGLASRFPWINPEGLAGGATGGSHEGWIAPDALMNAFRRKAQALGVEFRQDEVVAIARDGARVTGATLKSGRDVGCGTLVNAAGPRAGAVAALIDVPLPVVPRKRYSYIFDCRAELPEVMPLMVDVTGVATRPEGQHYIAILSPPEDQDPDCPDLEMDYADFEETIWPILATRIPAYEAIKLNGGWAGHYDYNTLDQNAILGPHPEISNLMFCNGFSGHGIQQSPAAGRAVAEQIAHGGYRSLDLTVFGYERIAAGRPMKEANVV